MLDPKYQGIRRLQAQRRKRIQAQTWHDVKFYAAVNKEEKSMYSQELRILLSYEKAEWVEYDAVCILKMYTHKSIICPYLHREKGEVDKVNLIIHGFFICDPPLANMHL